MKVSRSCWLPLAIVLAVVAPSAVANAGWVPYEAKSYGFTMLVPEGTHLAEKEWEGGWGELWAEFEGVKLYALAKLGEQASAEAIEKLGVRLTGIPADAWTVIDKGENESGWTWFRTVKAEKGGTVVFGGYGVGKKGSYLLVLKTTTADFAENRSDYEAWYASVRLH